MPEGSPILADVVDVDPLDVLGRQPHLGKVVSDPPNYPREVRREPDLQITVPRGIRPVDVTSHLGPAEVSTETGNPHLKRAIELQSSCAIIRGPQKTSGRSSISPSSGAGPSHASV